VPYFGLCFGRFSDFDKQDLIPLLQAFQRVVKPGLPWRFIFSGAVHDPTYFKMLQAFVKGMKLGDRVEFIIEPNEKAKAQIFAAADFFVAIADNPQETFGLTLLEAMHAGLPLIVSDFNGYRELCHEDVGFRVPTRWMGFSQLDLVSGLLDELSLHRFAGQSISVDVDALSNALGIMFSDQEQRKRMSVASRERFQRVYAHKNTIARLEQHWRHRKQDSRPRSPEPDPLGMAMFDTFSHYVTHSVRDTDQVVLSELGYKLLLKKTNTLMVLE